MQINRHVSFACPPEPEDAQSQIRRAPEQIQAGYKLTFSNFSSHNLSLERVEDSADTSKSSFELTSIERSKLRQQWKNWAGKNISNDIQRKKVCARMNDWLEDDNACVPLNLRYLELKSVPPLPERTQHIDLTGNYLESLPKKWPHCLVLLSLSMNKLTQFTGRVGPYLEELHLDNNNLTQFPENLLPGLLTLWLSNNKLTDLPKNPFPGLKELCVYSNQIMHLPPTMYESLEILNVGNNPLQTLPLYWGRHLKKLTLPLGLGKNNCPVNLPGYLTAEADQHPSAQCINFHRSDNSRTVEKMLEQRNATPKSALKNPIIQLDPYAWKTENEVIPDDNSFGLSGDQRSLLLNTWHKWVDTDVAESQKEIVYNILERWLKNDDASLRLELRSFQLSSIPLLPDRTRYLDLTNNRLAGLPEQWPQSIIQLKLGSNLLTEFTGKVGSGLQELDLDNNQLTQFPKHLPPSMKTFSSRNNQLKTLPRILYPMLESLALNGNPIQILPEVWGKHLKSVSLPAGLGPNNRPENLPEYLIPNSDSFGEANRWKPQSIEFVRPPEIVHRQNQDSLKMNKPVTRYRRFKNWIRTQISKNA